MPSVVIRRNCTEDARALVGRSVPMISHLRYRDSPPPLRLLSFWRPPRAIAGRLRRVGSATFACALPVPQQRGSGGRPDGWFRPSPVPRPRERRLGPARNCATGPAPARSIPGARQLRAARTFVAEVFRRAARNRAVRRGRRHCGSSRATEMRLLAEREVSKIPPSGNSCRRNGVTRQGGRRASV